MSSLDTASTPERERRGRRRIILALGSFLGIGALLTAAYFTDVAYLNFGAHGFGSTSNKYNLQVSAGQENTVAAVPTSGWIEANPTAATISSIAGAGALLPGGSVVMKIPTRNQSTAFGSTLAIDFTDITATTDVTADQQARNLGYLKLLRFEVAVTDSAATAPTTWVTKTAVKISDAGGSTASIDLGSLAAGAGTVVYVKVSLVEGATQAETDAANGGTATIQAKVSGTSVASAS